MLTEPTDLDRRELEAIVERHWRLRAPTLEYLPVGFGSHHWKAVDADGERRFVTVDDLEAGFQVGPDTESAFDALDRAFRTAAALRDEVELDFVVAPLPDHDGVVIRRVSDRYAVTVSPLVEGEAGRSGFYESGRDRRRMGGILGRLHAATDHVPAELPRREDFQLPSRAALREAVEDLDHPWRWGPFGEPARQLLDANAGDLGRRLEEYDELVTNADASSDGWVVTHGEPHSANVIRDRRGGLYLVDWDTTLIAPRERDLRVVLDRDGNGWDEYAAVAGSVALNEETFELYRRRWDLAEICIYTALFRRPHRRTEDTTKAWNSLTGYLRRLAKPGR